MRGGSRFKFNIHTGTSDLTSPSYPSPNVNYARVSTVPSGTFVNTFEPEVTMVGTSLELYLKDIVSNNSGALLDCLWIHNSLEYEVPYLNRTRFVNPRKLLPMYVGTAQAEVPRIVFEIPIFTAQRRVDLWQAAADDFSLHFFMFVPEYRSCNQDA